MQPVSTLAHEKCLYIGYSYVDEYGEAEIYWFPYDMIVDEDTGAIEYVPVG